MGSAICYALCYVRPALCFNGASYLLCSLLCGASSWLQCISSVCFTWCIAKSCAPPTHTHTVCVCVFKLVVICLQKPQSHSWAHPSTSPPPLTHADSFPLHQVRHPQWGDRDLVQYYQDLPPHHYSPTSESENISLFKCPHQTLYADSLSCKANERSTTRAFALRKWSEYVT